MIEEIKQSNLNVVIIDTFGETEAVAILKVIQQIKQEQLIFIDPHEEIHEFGTEYLHSAIKLFEPMRQNPLIIFTLVKHSDCSIKGAPFKTVINTEEKSGNQLISIMNNHKGIMRVKPLKKFLEQQCVESDTSTPPFAAIFEKSPPIEVAHINCAIVKQRAVSA